MVEKGATTVWELWNGDTADAGMNSHNIVMLIGDLDLWLHEYLGGIRPDPEVPGFKRIIIQPEVVGGLTWGRDSYDSVHGPINSEWRQSAGQFDLKVGIPANTTATVFWPVKNIESVTENGRGLRQTAGVKSFNMADGRAVFASGSPFPPVSWQQNKRTPLTARRLRPKMSA